MIKATFYSLLPLAFSLLPITNKFYFNFEKISLKWRSKAINKLNSMIINLNTPPSQPSANLKVTLRIENLKSGQFAVSIAEFPHFRVQAPTKEEAIVQLQTSFIEQISHIETISWTTPLDNPSPNWLKFAGIFENDADFQEIMDKLQAERTSDDDSEVDTSYYL